MSLIRLTPLTKRGEAGMASIIDEANLDAWIREHGPRLLAEGYTKVAREPHEPTGIVGDRRKHRRSR